MAPLSRVAQSCGTYRSTGSPSLPSGDLVSGGAPATRSNGSPRRERTHRWLDGARAVVFGRSAVTDDALASSEAGQTAVRGRSVPAPPAVRPSPARRIAVAAVAAALLVAPPAFGQTTSAQSGYSAPAGSVQQQLQGTRDAPEPTARQAATTNRLPFSGLDVAFVLAAGGLLLAIGVSMRRLSRPPA